MEILESIEGDEDKVIENGEKILKIIAPPHNKISRDVDVDNEAEMALIRKIAPAMLKLCYTKSGIYNGSLGVAHCQVEAEDPLRFFVTKDGFVVINPVITNNTKAFVDSEEGCLSFPDKKPVVVLGYNKVTVDYGVLYEKGVNMGKENNINGQASKVFQNAIDMMDGKYIHKVEG